MRLFKSTGTVENPGRGLNMCPCLTGRWVLINNTAFVYSTVEFCNRWKHVYVEAVLRRHLLPDTNPASAVTYVHT
jgi:hypothetical protein